MSKRTQAKSTPEQKAAWKANQRLGSRFIRVIPAPLYMEYLNSEASVYQYDEKGFRTK